MNISEEEFAEIINKNQNRLHHICRVYAHRIADEKDMFQEIIIRVWRSFPSFNAQADISTWIYRIGVNTAISYLRKKKTRQNYYSTFQREEENRENSYYEHNYGYEDEQTRKLYTAIDKLNVSEKAMITMYLDDFSYKEIGFVTDMTENYVGVKLNRIKKKLSNLIDSCYEN